jgi:hypothetical protein
MYPWPFPEKINLQVTGNTFDMDFIGIKVGDVNNTVQPNANAIIVRKEPSTVSMTTSDQTFQPNTIINIPVALPGMNVIIGFQFTLGSEDLEFLGVVSGKLDIAEDDYALFGNEMTMSWFDIDATKINPSDVLFTVQAIAKKPGTLSQTLRINSSLTEAELYSGDEEIFKPRLHIINSNNGGLQVYPAEPNPWNEHCTIPFYNPADGKITFVCYNTAGQKEMESNQIFQKGMQTIELNRNEFKGQGLKFFILQSERESTNGKIILVK